MDNGKTIANDGGSVLLNSTPQVMLSEAEINDALTLARLITERSHAEEVLFNFFEKVPEDVKPRVYERAMETLAAAAEKAGMPETSVQ